jgi:hypothetical protein
MLTLAGFRQEHVNADIYQELLRMWSPRAKGCILTENTFFGRFSTGLHQKNAQQLLGEFWFLEDLLPYSQDLNLLDFATRHILQAKAQATPYLLYSCLEQCFSQCFKGTIQQPKKSNQIDTWCVL